MFMHDRWEDLAATTECNPRTLHLARELACEMCQKIFDVLGMTVDTDEKHLKVMGRGLTYMFQLRSDPKPQVKNPYKRKRRSKPTPVLDLIE